MIVNEFGVKKFIFYVKKNNFFPQFDLDLGTCPQTGTFKVKVRNLELVGREHNSGKPFIQPLSL